MIPIHDWQYLNRCLWMVLAAVWAIGVLFSKRTVRKQNVQSRLKQSGLLLVGFYLVFVPEMPLSQLNKQMIQITEPVAIAGIALTAAGIAFAIWARISLGGNWSARVTLKDGHTLITNGPYRFVRHPIYTGLSVSITGTALMQGSLHNLLGVAACIGSFCLKIMTEEKFMDEQFGAEYAMYRKHVKALAPFLF